MGICSLGSFQQGSGDNVGGCLGLLDLFHQNCGSQLQLLAGKFGQGRELEIEMLRRGIGEEEGGRLRICSVSVCMWSEPGWRAAFTSRADKNKPNTVLKSGLLLSVEGPSPDLAHHYLLYWRIIIFSCYPSL